MRWYSTLQERQIIRPGPPIGGPFNFTRCANGTKRRPNALPFLIYTLTEGECNCVVSGWHFYDSEHYLARIIHCEANEKRFRIRPVAGEHAYGTQPKTSITILTLIADSIRHSDGICMPNHMEFEETKTQRHKETSTHTHTNWHHCGPPIIIPNRYWIATVYEM